MEKRNPRIIGVGAVPDHNESSAMPLSSIKNRVNAQRGCLVEVYARSSAGSWELKATIDNSAGTKMLSQIITTDASDTHLDFLSSRRRRVRVKELPPSGFGSVAPPDSSVPVSEAAALSARLTALEAVSFRTESVITVPNEVTNGSAFGIAMDCENEPVMVYLDPDGSGFSLIHPDEYSFSGNNINFVNITMQAGSKLQVLRWSADA